MSTTLINIQITDDNLQISISLVLGALLLLIPLALFLIRKRYWFWQADVDLEIKLGNIGKVKIKPNYEVKQIAHKAWVELKTRKAGLPIDKENDVISDVYKSWYELFKEIRELTRDIPASKLKDKATKQLVDLLVNSLNEGLRPHLTRWRAKYSRWYQKAVLKSDHDDLTPQEIQKEYPQYKELVDDMVEINEQLVEYTNEIKKLVEN